MDKIRKFLDDIIMLFGVFALCCLVGLCDMCCNGKHGRDELDYEDD